LSYIKLNFGVMCLITVTIPCSMALSGAATITFFYSLGEHGLQTALLVTLSLSLSLITSSVISFNYVSSISRFIRDSTNICNTYFFRLQALCGVIGRFDFAVLTVLGETIAFLHTILFSSLHKRITAFVNCTWIDQSKSLALIFIFH
jgi:hypothetical protein